MNTSCETEDSSAHDCVCFPPRRCLDRMQLHCSYLRSQTFLVVTEILPMTDDRRQTPADSYDKTDRDDEAGMREQLSPIDLSLCRLGLTSDAA